MKINIIGSDAERRAGLKTLLRRVERQAQFNEVRDWRQARIIHKRGKPDMVVIDWTPTMRTFELQPLLQDVEGVPVAVVVDFPCAAQVFSMIGLGVTGVIPRSLNPVLVLRAFDMVMIGGHYIPAGIIDPRLGRDLLPRRIFDHIPKSKAIRMDLKLSPRQEQIMRCVHMGSTNKMIARTLGISEGTVKIHLASVFQQLGATNRAAAVAIYNGVQSEHLQILRSDMQRAAEEDAADAEAARAASSSETSAAAQAPDDAPATGAASVEAEAEAEVTESVPTLGEEAPEAPAASEQTPQVASAAGSEPTADASDAPDASPDDGETDIVETNATNVIPLRGGDVKYPSLTDNEFPPLPMAAQPESSF
jgi:DNA-binding NarL/FixJ family response regulator